MPNKYSLNDLNEIERQTIGYFDKNTNSFWLGTRDHEATRIPPIESDPKGF